MKMPSNAAQSHIISASQGNLSGFLTMMDFGGSDAPQMGGSDLTLGAISADSAANAASYVSLDNDYSSMFKAYSSTGPIEVEIPEMQKRIQAYNQARKASQQVDASYASVAEAAAAISAIPASKTTELLSDFRELAEENSVGAIIDAVTKWLLIGGRYLADPTYQPTRKAGGAAGLVVMSDDFDEPLDVWD